MKSASSTLLAMSEEEEEEEEGHGGEKRGTWRDKKVRIKRCVKREMAEKKMQSKKVNLAFIGRKRDLSEFVRT